MHVGSRHARLWRTLHFKTSCCWTPVWSQPSLKVHICLFCCLRRCFFTTWLLPASVCWLVLDRQRKGHFRGFLLKTAACWFTEEIDCKCKMAPFRVQWKLPPWPERQNFSSRWIYFLVYHEFLVNPQTLHCDDVSSLSLRKVAHISNLLMIEKATVDFDRCLFYKYFLGLQEEFLLLLCEWPLQNLKWGSAAFASIQICGCET